MKTAIPSLITYTLSAPNEWYAELAVQKVGAHSANSCTLHPTVGSGQLQCITFQEGFWAQQMQVSFNQPMPLLQTASATNEVFIINFYLTNAAMKQQTDEKLFEFTFDSISVMLTSAATTCHYTIPAKEAIQVFQIGCTRAWLLANVFDAKPSVLKSIFTKDAPIYMAEHLDYQLKYLVKEIDFTSSSRLFLFSRSLQLLHIVFSKLENRAIASPDAIHYTDLENLIAVRMQMDAEPLSAIRVETLAQQSGMSLSKFKRYFKQVFGCTPYQYHLKNKMAIATDRLHQNYTVSEVAYLLGYKNLSHFSKAFKKHYGCLPSEVHT